MKRRRQGLQQGFQLPCLHPSLQQPLALFLKLCLLCIVHPFCSLYWALTLAGAEEAAGTNLTSPAGGALPGDGKVALEPLGGSNWKSEV